MSSRTKVLALRAMPCADRQLVAEAAILLGVSRLLLLSIPFRLIVPLLSRKIRCSLESRHQPPDRRVRWAAMIAARNVPFRAVCLPQAMAAKFMLARRGYPSILHLGVGKNDASNLIGHAWLP
jgi:Transglutaminase-like superfamily